MVVIALFVVDMTISVVVMRMFVVNMTTSVADMRISVVYMRISVVYVSNLGGELDNIFLKSALYRLKYIEIMLLWDFKKVMKMRGIDHPFTYLRKPGVSHNLACRCNYGSDHHFPIEGVKAKICYTPL